MYKNVHGSTFYNSQKVTANQIFINKRMNQKLAVRAKNVGIATTIHKY